MIDTTSDYGLSFDADDLLTDAYARIGGEGTTGYNARSGRRALQLMFQDWQNRDVLMWTLDTISFPLVEGVSEYVLPSDTSGVLEMSIEDTRTNTKTPVTRIGRGAWVDMTRYPAKGLPNQMFVNMGRADIAVSLWPVPDDRPLRLTGYRVRYTRDVSAMTSNLDMPRRFITAAVSGLAFYLGRERPEAVDEGKLARLKAEYLEDLANAAEADKDSSDMRLLVDLSYYS